MDERSINKAIGYGIAIIIAYNVIAYVIPLLTWSVVGLVLFRVYQEYQKYKH